ncbi:MAG: radical SAM protein [Candidatus Hydrogenedentes bacterium]|nr:radical SAM protein [Candidatus Hydrogenedentota bacterium]
MPEESFKYVFGPVPSRRLGRSLGVDLVPCKTCSYDCVYCQVGRTTVKTVERKEYVPYEAVLAEIQRKLDGGAAPDYVTMSGSGEPTLFAKLGALIRAVKAMTDTPVAVITNGSLLWMPEVRAELLDADLVVPSLDAGTPAMFERANRPHPDLRFEQMVDGLIAFREAFPKAIWLEVFLLGGCTDDEVRALAGYARRIRPDRVQLNTVARPPAESDARPVPQADLERYAAYFEPPGEVIADFTGVHDQQQFAASREEVLDLLRRRPCSLEDVAQGLRIHRHEAAKHIQHLQEEALIRAQIRGDVTFFVAEDVPRG